MGLLLAQKSASRRATTRVFTDRQSEYLLSVDPRGLRAWVTSNGNDGGNMKAALSRDTDTGEGGRERGREGEDALGG